MAKQLELTPRLQQIADWVTPGSRVADVGTDHAYLPVWLVLHDRIPYAIASDLRPGPLERAQKTGRIWNSGDRVAFRLGNGLSSISPEECDTVVIAGMGGETIVSILNDADWTRDGCHTLLLQPQTHAETLRAFLAQNGYLIQRESLVFDRGTIYPILEVTAGKMELSLGQLWGGAKLLRDPLGDRYLIERIVRLQGAVAGLNRSSKDDDQIKADEVRSIITSLMIQREEWRHANCP